MVFLGEFGLDYATIATITGHKLNMFKRILENYVPRNDAMAARAVVARRQARGGSDAGNVVQLQNDRAG